MIKFVHKKHMHLDNKDSKVVIYYNASDILLGIALLALVVFFIHDYLSHALGDYDDAGLYTSQTYKN
ncbi:MAG: hypothetical protein NTZ87_03945 [Candidatus Nomurabacteria bacterium]|nr:hypothetical protein [Candidatus Nomurabacteria bacterium]